MTDAERLEAIWAKLHGGSQVTADEIVFLESEHGKTVQSYHKALEERWAEIVELLAEVERLRGVVRVAREIALCIECEDEAVTHHPALLASLAALEGKPYKEENGG